MEGQTQWIQMNTNTASPKGWGGAGGTFKSSPDFYEVMHMNIQII